MSDVLGSSQLLHDFGSPGVSHDMAEREREKKKKANIKLTIILNKLTHFRNLTSLAISGIFKVSISSI